jgi:hypothetical protein
MRPGTTWWILAAAVLAFATPAEPAAAQPGALPPIVPPKDPQPRNYVEFAIGPDYEEILKDRLQLEKQVGPLRDLVKQILADPSKFQLDTEQFKGFKLDDPQLKKAVQEWTTRDPEVQQALREWIQQNPQIKRPEDVQKLQENLKSLLDQPPAKDTGADAPLPAGPEAPPNAPDDPLADLTERALKEAEDSRVGEWLRDSVAWRNALDELHTSLRRPDHPGRWNAWQDRLHLPEGMLRRLSGEALERLRHLPRPNVERLKGKLRLPGWSGISMPSLQGTPSLPTMSGPSLPSLGRGMMLILAALLVGLVAWHFLGRRRKALAAAADDGLGPWPVRPDAVATRGELVRAFDYLALWKLGADVRSWNHQAIAHRFVERSPIFAGVAVSLAALYEQARYTDGAEPLTPADRDLAQRCLVQLAEVL